MKRIALIFAIGLAGCATPHRVNETTHTIKKYAGRSDGLIAVEEWRDYHKSGANLFFVDPNSQGFCDKYTNQPALGGNGWFMAAPFSAVVDPNTGAIIGAGGTAIGNVVGAAVKTAIK